MGKRTKCQRGGRGRAERAGFIAGEGPVPTSAEVQELIAEGVGFCSWCPGPRPIVSGGNTASFVVPHSPTEWTLMIACERHLEDMADFMDDLYDGLTGL